MIYPPRRSLSPRPARRAGRSDSITLQFKTRMKMPPGQVSAWDSIRGCQPQAGSGSHLQMPA
eukprot:2670189-Rhodomonas_salina.1